MNEESHAIVHVYEIVVQKSEINLQVRNPIGVLATLLKQGLESKGSM